MKNKADNPAIEAKQQMGNIIDLFIWNPRLLKFDDFDDLDKLLPCRNLIWKVAWFFILKGGVVWHYNNMILWQILL